MDLRRFTTKAQEALGAAQATAVKRGHPSITTDHLLAALLAQRDGIVPRVLSRIGARAIDLGREIPK